MADSLPSTSSMRKSMGVQRSFHRVLERETAAQFRGYVFGEILHVRIADDRALPLAHSMIG